jgi:hypothetical protein
VGQHGDGLPAALRVGVWMHWWLEVVVVAVKLVAGVVQLK